MEADSDSTFMIIEDDKKLKRPKIYHLNTSVPKLGLSSRRKVCSGNLVVMFLGLLCFLLLVLIISIWKKHDSERNELQKGYNNLTVEKDKLQSSYSTLYMEDDRLRASYNNLTLERDRLHIRYNTLNMEKDLIQTSFNNMTLERDRLQTSYNNMTLEKDKFQTSYNNMTLERDRLQTSYNKMTLERDRLQTSYNNMTLQRDQLQTSYNNMTLEKDKFQKSYNNMTLERDRLQSSYNNLTVVKETLQSSYNNLSSEKKQLQSRYDALIVEKNKLQKNLDEMKNKSCSDGWTTFQGNCFYVSTSQNNWDQSKQNCIQKGAGLMIINSIEKQRFVAKLGKKLWIGLSDQHLEGMWKWVDGTPLKTGYWRPGEPNNSRRTIRKIEDEDCAEVVPSEGEDVTSSWNDVPCSTMNFWICMKKMG